MTPDEARTKWCPFARKTSHLQDTNGNLAAATYNRNGDGKASEFCLCLADGCAAWRWGRAFDPNIPVDHAPLKTGEGYCGLAGKE